MIVMGVSYIVSGKLEPGLRFHFYPLAERKRSASPGEGKGPGHQPAARPLPCVSLCFSGI